MLKLNFVSKINLRVDEFSLGVSELPNRSQLALAKLRLFFTEVLSLVDDQY